MNAIDLYFRVLLLGPDGRPKAYLGTAFLVAPDGTLMTCRHVVDVNLETGESVAILDDASDRLIRVEQSDYPSDPAVDLAFLRGVLGPRRDTFFPLLPVADVRVGEDVHSYGFYLPAGERVEAEAGYFKGNIVGVSTRHFPPRQVLTTSYPLVEGLSGSPVSTYHNGPKVVGVGFGSVSTRVVASEVLDYNSGSGSFTETVHRVVEFGLAHHSGTVAAEALALAVPVLVSADRVPMPGME